MLFDGGWLYLAALPVTTLFSRLFSRLHLVHRASSPEEREAIYRFRYSVYVDELKREVPGADHSKKRVVESEDEAPWTTHLYAGSREEQVTAALRVRHFAPGQIPAALADDFSLELVPGVDQLAVAVLDRFLSLPSLGVGVLMPSLAASCWELLGEQGVDLVAFSCRPDLVPQHEAIGARLFGGRLISRPEGLQIPLLLVPADDDHLRKVGSPAAGFAHKYFGPGKRAPIDSSTLAGLFSSGQRSIVTDPAAVSTELQKALLGGRQPPVFLQTLDKDTVRRLASQGFILGVPKEAIVVREGRAERELFAILEGSFEVSVQGKTINALGRGDIFGEVAFFTASGRRSATVRAVTPGRLVVIRPRFLDELARRDAKAGMVIVQNLARILAERLVHNIPGHR